MAKHHSDSNICREQPGNGNSSFDAQLCEKCDGKSTICKCNDESYRGRCTICGEAKVAGVNYCKQCKKTLSPEESQKIFGILKSFITQSNYDEVKSIIVKDSGSLHVTDDTDTTLLHLAASKGNKDLVKFFIDSGCNLNAKNSQGTTPLLAACLYNQYEVIKFLVHANAEIDVTNTNGKSPMAIALCRKRRMPVDVVKCFYERLKRNGYSSEQIGQKFVEVNCSLESAYRMNDPDLRRVVLESCKKTMRGMEIDIRLYALEYLNLLGSNDKKIEI